MSFVSERTRQTQVAVEGTASVWDGCFKKDYLHAYLTIRHTF